jgi:hypothetical protein
MIESNRLADSNNRIIKSMSHLIYSMSKGQMQYLVKDLRFSHLTVNLQSGIKEINNHRSEVCYLLDFQYLIIGLDNFLQDFQYLDNFLQDFHYLIKGLDNFLLDFQYLIIGLDNFLQDFHYLIIGLDNFLLDLQLTVSSTLLDAKGRPFDPYGGFERESEMGTQNAPASQLPAFGPGR